MVKSVPHIQLADEVNRAPLREMYVQSAYARAESFLISKCNELITGHKWRQRYHGKEVSTPAQIYKLTPHHSLCQSNLFLSMWCHSDTDLIGVSPAVMSESFVAEKHD